MVNLVGFSHQNPEMLVSCSWKGRFNQVSSIFYVHFMNWFTYLNPSEIQLSEMYIQMEYLPTGCLDLVLYYIFFSFTYRDILT